MKTLVCLILMTAIPAFMYAQQDGRDINPWVTKHFHRVPGEKPGPDCMKPPYQVNELIPVVFHLLPGNDPAGIDTVDPCYCVLVKQSKLGNIDHVSPGVVGIKGKIAVWNPVGQDYINPWHCTPVSSSKIVIHN